MNLAHNGGENLNKKDEQNQKELDLVSKWSNLFKNSMVHKSEYTKKWKLYQEAYDGVYFSQKNLPDYRSDMVSNYIFSIIETIRPIMLDNDPKFQAVARQPDGMDLSNDLQEALSYEWDREKVNTKLYRELINTLTIGNSIFFVPWDKHKKQISAVPVNPFNIFVDPLATSFDDADYVIYATYSNVDKLKRMFPKKKDKLTGSQVNYSELVADNDSGAMINNQVLVLEIYDRGFDTSDGDDGDESTEVNPDGRIITLCPELGVVLDDKKNPYEDGSFPFIIIKDYDVPGKFWGEGEVAQLISPQKYMNELNNAIIDNAKSTANMPWIVDKNSGIGVGKISARPGLIIRKNPGSEVMRPNAPAMPNYVQSAVLTFKDDMEMVSGIHNTLRGENSSGVYTAQGILALQEAGQVRVRLKVKILEEALASMANMWVSRMKQFWKEDRFIATTKMDGSYDLKKFMTKNLDYEYDVKITAGSTMPVNRSAMLDLMIRLAQTQMADGQALVDREAVVQYLPEEVKASLMERMKDNQSSLQEIEQAIEEMAKALEEIGQGLEQVAEESDGNDEQIFGVVEELTAAIEEINERLLQLNEEYDIMVQEEEVQKKQKEMEDNFYNQGYTDAEKINKTNQTPISSFESDYEALPEDMLAGIENMSDEELQALIEQEPGLIDLIK